MAHPIKIKINKPAMTLVVSGELSQS